MNESLKSSNDRFGRTNFAKRLGAVLVVGLGGVAIVSAATGASSGAVAADLDEFATITIVEGETDLSYSGFVDGTVRHLESKHGLSSSQLADRVIDAVEDLGCEQVSSVSGHPMPEDPNDRRMHTIIAEQFDCGSFYAEIGWSTDESGVDIVIGEGSDTLTGN